MPPFAQVSAARSRWIGVTAFALLSACTASQDVTQGSGGTYDPFESANRDVHAFNKGLDKNLVRPVANGYVRVVPEPIRTGINNFSDNIGMPSVVVNNLLQLNIREASIATLRFGMNTTIGLGGLLDPATAFAIPAADTDFGETLAVWGANEGPYVEVPVFGPSTTRDTIGDIVDLFTNPLTTSLTGADSYYSPATWGLSQLNDRGRFSSTIDSLLYDSADSYAQARSIYLQNRRFELGQSGADDSLDPYSDPYNDPYEDPYE